MAQVGASKDDFLKGLLLTPTNSKPILFFVAFFPLFIIPSETPFSPLLCVGDLFQLVNLSYFGLTICVTVWLSTLPMVQGFMRGGFNKFVGTILVIMASLIIANAFF